MRRARLSYGIAFTPRSGSTYLSDLVRQSRALGSPGEYFNINAAFDSISLAACTRFEDYYAWLSRVRQTNSVFGFEISAPWLQRLAQDGHLGVLDSVQQWFFLRRRDYVLQGVSLFLAMQSGVFHQRDDQAEEGESSGSPEFDADAITESILQLMNGEVVFNRHFRDRGVTPRELWYEDIVDLPPADFLEDFAQQLGVDLSSEDRARIAGIEPRLQRSGDGRNSAFAQRFREERADFVAHWDEYRGRMGAAAWRATAEGKSA